MCLGNILLLLFRVHKKNTTDLEYSEQLLAHCELIDGNSRVFR